MKPYVQHSKPVSLAQFEKPTILNPELENLKEGILDFIMEVIEDERIDKLVREG